MKPAIHQGILEEKPNKIFITKIRNKFSLNKLPKKNNFKKSQNQ